MRTRDALLFALKWGRIRRGIDLRGTLCPWFLVLVVFTGLQEAFRRSLWGLSDTSLTPDFPLPIAFQSNVALPKYSTMWSSPKGKDKNQGPVNSPFKKPFVTQPLFKQSGNKESNYSNKTPSTREDHSPCFFLLIKTWCSWFCLVKSMNTSSNIKSHLFLLKALKVNSGGA